jgi:inhibitor of cysteine peptidase
LVFNMKWLIVITALFITSCAPSVIRLNDTDNGRKLELREGQEIVVSLESNPTTGYIWEISNIGDGIIAQVGETTYESKSDLVGAGGIQVFRLKANESGVTDLNFVYHRPWEKNVKPVRTFSLKITVKGKEKYHSLKVRKG